MLVVTALNPVEKKLFNEYECFRNSGRRTKG